jgi:hypothetical protein
MSSMGAAHAATAFGFAGVVLLVVLGLALFAWAKRRS